jgi:methionyl aminopeptidase
VIIRKNAAEIAKMEASGAVLAAVFDLLEGMIRPGVRTEELDRAVERFIRSRGATPTFKGYRGFPGSICASPNELVVHGIPGRYALKPGDIISIDVGVTLEGWVADAARTFAVGAVDRASENLLRATERALYAGIEQARVGNRIGDISHAIQTVAEGSGLSLIRQLVGHGVGRSMHEDPQVPNVGVAGRGVRLVEGMVLAIEPMSAVGRPAVRVGADGWGVYTIDRSRAAHFEHTVAICAQGPRILTPWHLPAAERAGGGVPLEGSRAAS